MDTWNPFIEVVKDKLSPAKIVLDLFHVVAHFDCVIDEVRNSEYSKASKDDKALCSAIK